MDTISGLNENKVIENFYEKELQKTNQEEFRKEKVIRKKAVWQMEGI